MITNEAISTFHSLFDHHQDLSLCFGKKKISTSCLGFLLKKNEFYLFSFFYHLYLPSIVVLYSSLSLSFSSSSSSSLLKPLPIWSSVLRAKRSSPLISCSRFSVKVDQCNQNQFRLELHLNSLWSAWNVFVIFATFVILLFLFQKVKIERQKVFLINLILICFKLNF